MTAHGEGPSHAAFAWSAWSALATPPPFDFEVTAAALRRRPGNRLDRLDEGVARRLLPLGSEDPQGAPEVVALEVRARRDGLPGVEWRIGREPSTAVAGARPDAAGAAGASGAIARAVRRAYGLDVSPRLLEQTARSDDRLWAVLEPAWARLAGLRPPRTASPWEAVVIATCCQQLTLDVGLTHAARLAELAGTAWTDDQGVTLVALPLPGALAAAQPSDLRGIGLSRAKAATLTRVARLVAGGELDLDALDRAPTPDARAALLAVPGIGPWTAENVLLRGFGRLEVFPSGDAGMARAIERSLGPAASGAHAGARSYRALAELTGAWSPARGWAYFALAWASRPIGPREAAAGERP